MVIALALFQTIGAEAETQKRMSPPHVKPVQAPLSPQRSRDQAAVSLRSSRLICFIASVILLTAAFGHALASLAKYAAATDLHSHILLIPFISTYLIFIRRKQLPREYASSPGWTALLLAGGLAALLAAAGPLKADPPPSQNDSLSLMALSFVCLLAAAGFLFLGRKWMAATAFPFAFLIFMVPLPGGMVDVAGDGIETGLDRSGGPVL